MRKHTKEEVEKAIKNMEEKEKKNIARAKQELTWSYEGKMKAMKDEYNAIIEVYTMEHISVTDYHYKLLQRLESETMGLCKLLHDLDEANEMIKV